MEEESRSKSQVKEQVRVLRIIEYVGNRDRFLNEAERCRLNAREASFKIERAREQLGQLP